MNFPERFGPFLISAFSAQGPRAEQQDRWVCAPLAGDHFLLAVFDGHGSADVADFASRQIVELLAFRLMKEDPAAALRSAVKELVALTRAQTSGSTATLVVLTQNADAAYVAVLGDSPVALVDDRHQLIVGPTHNACSNATERQAAQARGAVFAQGYLVDPAEPAYGLQMARALGDRPLDRILSREPDVYQARLSPQSWILVGTDGLLGPPSEGVEARMQSLLSLAQRGQAAEALVQDALERQTGDNVTLILARPAA